MNNELQYSEDYLRIDASKIQSPDDLKLIIHLLNITVHKENTMQPFMLHLCYDEDLYKYNSLN